MGKQNCYKCVYHEGKILGHHGGASAVFYHNGDHVVLDMEEETFLRRFRHAGHDTQTRAFAFAEGYDSGVDIGKEIQSE